MTPRAKDLINELVGSAHIFSSVVDELMEEQLRAVADDELTFGQLKLLKLVSLARPATISDVATFLGVTLAAASKAVDRLARSGFLLRSESPTDRRVIVLSITPKGRQLLRRYNAARDRVLERVFGNFPRARLARLTRFLDQLSASTVEVEGHAEEICFRCGVHFRDTCLLRDLPSHNCHFQRHRKRTERRTKAG